MRWTLWPAVAIGILYAIVLGSLDPYGISGWPHPVPVFFAVWALIAGAVWMRRRWTAHE
jgi:hypothetical protein